MEKEIERIIGLHEKKGDFIYKKNSNHIIEGVEKKLMITLPMQYKWFLEKYGAGGLDGFEIIGIHDEKYLSVIDMTEMYRNEGLPNWLIVIEDCCEWLYCINCLDESVVSWYWSGEIYDKEYDDFYTYLIDRLMNVVENFYEE